MIKQTIHRIIVRTHFWRSVGLDELSELYASSMLRTFALSILMVFLPFYFYQLGYSITAICLFYAAMFAFKAITDVGAGYFVARYGPKHAMVIACIFQLANAMLLIALPTLLFPIVLLGPTFGATASFFFVAYHVVFSKIKHVDHSGKEIGTMQTFEKLATLLGPLVGGVAGSLYGGQSIYVVAMLVLCASLWPLFRSPEPTVTHQKIRFSALSANKTWRDYVSYAALGVENTICVNLWPLYISLFALTGTVYAQLGAVTALAVLVSIGAAKIIGKYVDVRSARTLLRAGAVLNGLSYIVRPFVHSVLPALAVNTANEAITTSYRLPFLKGMYAAADESSGNRIVYVASMEWVGSISRATVWFMLAGLATLVSTYTIFVAGFIIAGIASFVIMLERFSALSPRSA